MIPMKYTLCIFLRHTLIIVDPNPGPVIQTVRLLSYFRATTQPTWNMLPYVAMAIPISAFTARSQ